MLCVSKDYHHGGGGEGDEMRSEGETLCAECCIQVDVPVPSKENRPKGFDMHRTPRMLNSTIRNMMSTNNTRAVCSLINLYKHMQTKLYVRMHDSLFHSPAGTLFAW